MPLSMAAATRELASVSSAVAGASPPASTPVGVLGAGAVVLSVNWLQPLLPVMPPEYYEENEERARETLGRLLQPEWGSPRSVVTTVRWGSPVEAIVAYAADLKVDMIVIATHGRTGLSHVLLGSVAERIVREAPCPVLTIRDTGKAKPSAS